MDPAQQEQLLSMLRDARAPEAIGWWPLAPGWWILIVLLIMATSVVSYLAIRHSNKNRYRRNALREASMLYTDYTGDNDGKAYLNNISQLLRRIIASICGREMTANLSGSNWVNLINQYSSAPLSSQSTDALAVQVYRSDPVTDIEELHREVCGWIQQHQIPTKKSLTSRKLATEKTQGQVTHD